MNEYEMIRMIIASIIEGVNDEMIQNANEFHTLDIESQIEIAIPDEFIDSISYDEFEKARNIAVNQLNAFVINSK